MLIKSPIEEKEALKNVEWVFYSMSNTHLFKKERKTFSSARRCDTKQINLGQNKWLYIQTKFNYQLIFFLGLNTVPFT